MFELNHCCRLCLRGYCLSLYGYTLCPVLLRLQRQQRGQCRAGRASRPPAEPRRGGEGGRHHSVPFQKVPTEETEERQLGRAKSGWRGAASGPKGRNPGYIQ